MAEPDDLLGKADALMARHFPGRAPAAPYAEIPVLDEVVDFIPAGDDLPVLTEYVVPAPDEAQIEALAADIHAALLLELQPRIDALVDEHLRVCLAPLIEKMFTDLRAELRQIARNVVSDATRAAVAQELERRKHGD